MIQYHFLQRAHCRFIKEEVETHDLTSLFGHNPPQDKMEEILQTSICTQLSGSDVTSNLDDTISFPATCAHCRFMKEQVETHLASLFGHNPPQDKMDEILRRSICSLDRDVVQVGSYSTQMVVKFSVVCSGRSCAFVQMTRYGFISCKSELLCYICNQN